MDLSLLLKLSDEFNINPLLVIGLFILAYSLLGFGKINRELHKKKDNEIIYWKNKYEKEKDKQLEYEIKKGLLRQAEMLNKN